MHRSAVGELSLLFLALFASTARADPCASVFCLDAVVVGVADGDTVTVLDPARRTQIKVRLTEIDTPERGQPWGSRARQALADKVFRRQVRVASQGEDRYGRTLARLYVGDRDINREMVREGHAWVYRRYSSDAWLLEDERAAQEGRRGLWSLPEAGRVPPWEWRRGARVASATRASAPTVAVGTSVPPTCGTKTYCREMSSCEEARFFLAQCGLTRLDGGGDGVPCERLCGGGR